MLSGPQKKFCEAYAVDRNGSAAYRAAYPKSSAKAAESGASRLLRNAKVKAEIERIRLKADEKAGSAVLTLAEKRSFLARVVRAKPALLERDSDLWQSIKATENGTEYRLPDKLGAIKHDNDLAGEGSEAEGQDAIADLLNRIRK